MDGEKEEICEAVGDRVLIQPYEPATKTSTGLELDNSTHNDAAVRGKIIHAGEQSKFYVGQEIFFRRHSMDKLKISTPEGEKVVCFVDCDDIIGLIS